MSEAPRQLWMLADAMSETANGHDRAAALMDPYDDNVATNLRALASQMRETVKQILAGRYGDPGVRR